MTIVQHRHPPREAIERLKLEPRPGRRPEEWERDLWVAWIDTDEEQGNG